MSQKEIWAELARRKVQFHPYKEWDTIELWGLFNWGAVSQLVKAGKLKTNYKKENKTVWVRPTADVWERHVWPLIQKYSLPELTRLAGWQV